MRKITKGARCTTIRAGHQRRPRAIRDEAKVYVGFWTAPENKKALFALARGRKQSASQYIDCIIEDHIMRVKARPAWGI